MKYLAQLVTHDGHKFVLPLKCRDYHAAKLQYVFSRTLDRSVFKDAKVLACDFEGVDDINRVIVVDPDVPFDLKLVSVEVRNG